MVTVLELSVASSARRSFSCSTAWNITYERCILSREFLLRKVAGEIIVDNDPKNCLRRGTNSNSRVLIVI